MRSKQVRGFTLVELLVVIAIIGVLIGMLLPAVQAVRGAAQRASCQNKLRQISLAALNYEAAFQRLPAGFTQERINNVYQGHSVFYFILPYIEQDNLYDSMDNRLPINNRATTPTGGESATVISMYLCPSDTLPNEPIGWPETSTPSQYYGGTSYRANGGSRPIYATSSTNDGTFMCVGPAARKAASAPIGIRVRMSEIIDGQSNTVFFGESRHDDLNFDTFTFNVNWNSGSSIKGWSRWYPSGGDNGLANIMGGSFAPINYQTPWAHGDPGAPTTQGAWFIHQDRRLSAFGSLHPGGANIGLADGSVRFVASQMQQTILTYYCQRADHTPIPDFE